MFTTSPTRAQQFTYMETGLQSLYHNKSTTGSQQDDFIWKPGFNPKKDQFKGIKSLQQVHNICNMFTTFATCSQRPQHVHNSLCIKKRLYVKRKTIPQPLQHVHNKLTIDTLKKYFNTHNKARIPATASRQVYDHCITTSLQQVHNKMIIYGNKA